MGCTTHTRMNRKDSIDRNYCVIYLLHPLVAVRICVFTFNFRKFEFEFEFARYFSDSRAVGL